MINKWNEDDQMFYENGFYLTSKMERMSNILSHYELYKEIGNVELVRGNILDTIPEYLKQHPNMKIALLHIDTDIYEPARVALEYLYDRVVRGGIIVSDDYTVAGETKAIDEFLKNKNLEIHKLSISQHKPSYIVRP